MIKKALSILGIFIFIHSAHASGVVNNVFDLPAFQTNGSGIFQFDVGHRYLDVNRHTTNVSISLSYGIFDFLDAYAAYAFKNKDIILGGKINFLDDYAAGKDIISLSLNFGGGYKDTNQINNSLSLSYIDSTKIEARSTLAQNDRLSFFIQPVIQKHLFKNRISLGIVPTYAHNTNFYGITGKNDFSAGSGFFMEIYVMDKISLNGEMVMNFYGFALKYATWNAGIKFAGYRHTFSLWAGNSAGYSPVEYIIGNNKNIVKISFAFSREFDI